MAHTQATRQSDLPAREAGRPWVWVLGALVAAAVVLIVLRPGDEEPGPGEVAVSPTQPAAGRVIRDAEPTATPARPGDLARTLIAEVRAEGKPYDLNALAEQARGFQQDARLADAHLLYFFAAREGHAPSALRLGSGFDPLHFVATESLMDGPDPVQALKWYRVAAEAGAPEAEARIAALRDWVQERADGGDESARRLLLAWQ